MRGIKWGVLEWKMRPFGLKKMQKTIYPNGPLSLSTPHCDIEPS